MILEVGGDIVDSQEIDKSDSWWFLAIPFIYTSFLHNNSPIPFVVFCGGSWYTFEVLGTGSVLTAAAFYRRAYYGHLGNDSGG